MEETSDLEQPETQVQENCEIHVAEGSVEDPTVDATPEEIPELDMVDPVPVAVETQLSERHEDGSENYPSLYDTIPTTFGAILLGVAIIALIQLKVKHIFDTQKKDHKALTQFVTTMFALIVGIWIADKLIAGPDTELLAESESRDVLNFIKDTTLMVFAYYFGTKAQVPSDEEK